MTFSDVAACASCGVSLHSAAISVHRKELSCPYCEGLVNPKEMPVPSIAEQEALIAHFGRQPVDGDKPSAQFAPARRLPLRSLQPVSLKPVESKASGEMHWLDPESSLTMTKLQQLAADDDRSSGTANLERRWLARRQHRQAERLMLNAAFYVALALIMGAVIFVQLEESTASVRQAADQRYAVAYAQHQEMVQREQDQALIVAREALSQPSWMEFLAFIKDSRQLLPEIRDHFDQWPHQPLQQPRLHVLERVEDESGVRVHLRLGLGAEAKTLVMTKVAQSFKVDWEASRVSLLQIPADQELPLCIQDLGTRYFGALEDF